MGPSLRIAAVIAFVTVTSGCGAPTEPPACGPTTCAGCCDATGLCQQGISAQTCGFGGAACVSCGTTLTCSAGACTASGTGGGGGATGGGTGGGAMTGGGSGGGAMTGGGTGGGAMTGGGTGGGMTGGGTGGGMTGGGTGGGMTGGGTGGGMTGGGTGTVDAGLDAGPILFPETNLTPFGTGSAAPDSLTVFGSRLCFSASTASLGRELWCSDGTRAGTVPVTDLERAAGDSNPTNLFVVGSNLFFSANTTDAGRELWVTDGTDAGARRLTNVAGTAGAEPTELTSLDGYLVFNCNGGLCGSDGTAGNTGVVSGFATNDPRNFIRFGGGLYYQGNAYLGRTLMKTDGFPMGTTYLDPYIRIADDAPPMAVLGNALYFACNDGNGTELCKSQAATQGTSAVLGEYANLAPGTASSSPHELTVAGSTLFFVADDGTRGRELYKTDGTDAGTALVKDINTSLWIHADPEQLTAVGSTLYFVADDGVNGEELWKSDGTAAGTVMVKDITPPYNGGPVLSGPSDLAVFNGQLYFVADDGVHGRELWKTDGTSAGTVMVDDVELGAYPHITTGSSNPAQLTPFSNKLFFSAFTTASGSELWSSTGTGKSRLFKDLNVAAGGSSSELVTAFGNLLLFESNDGETGPELWRTDGTVAGTYLLKDLVPGPTGPALESIVVAGSYAWFAATTANEGRELWRTDGTPAGTQLVADLAPGRGTYGAYDSSPESLTAVGNALFFQAFDGASNFLSLFRVVGTGAPQRLAPVWGYAGSSNINLEFAAVGSLLLFEAGDVASGVEMWRSDGTVSGTYRLADIAPGAESSYPDRAVAVGNTGYFMARPFNTGQTYLYKTDGTVAGTTEVANITPFNTTFTPRALASTGTKVLYRSHSSAWGEELFASDGTAMGTGLLKDLDVGTTSSEPKTHEGVTLNGVRYFAATDQATGGELWRSDGTAPGTFRLGDFAAGVNHSLIRPLRAATRGSLLYLVPDDRLGGSPVYVTDGTVAGTRLVHRAPRSSLAYEPSGFLASMGSRLYLASCSAEGAFHLYGFTP